MKNGGKLPQNRPSPAQIGLHPTFLDIPTAFEQGHIRTRGFMGKISP